ncbi:MAG: sigma-70 factor domain-containing protein, partial [Candidatus Rokuibacteriota bacterium]
MAVSRSRQPKTEDGLNRTPGELVPADKVEEVLRTLELPPTAETEDALPGAPDEYERAVEEEDEPVEESLAPEDPVRLYLREIGRIHLLNSEQEVS